MDLRVTASAAFALILAVVVPGCGDSNSTFGSSTARDSAGIRIIENAAPRLRDSLAWRLSQDPVQTIGSPDGEGEDALFQVLHLTRLSDGRVAVWDGGDHEVRLFDAAGQFSVAFGGEGEGPGEFQLLGAMRALPGDTLLLFDMLLHRATLFDDTGGVVRTTQLDPPGPQEGISALWRLPDGSYLARGGINAMYTGDGDGLVRERIWIGGLDEDGRATGVIMEYRGSETLVLGGGSQSAYAPFLRSSSAALVGDEIVRAFTRDYSLEFYNREGDLISYGLSGGRLMRNL